MAKLNKPHGKPSADKPKNFKGAMKKLGHYMSRYKIGLIFVVIFAMGGTIFQIVGPKILGRATTEIFKGLMSKISGKAGIDFTKIGHILLILLALYLVSAIFNLVQGFIMTGISQKLTYHMRKDIVEKINRLPMSFFDEMTHGEILSRITNDVDTLSQGLNQSASQVITSATMIIGVLVMMISISPLMTLVALLILPVSMGFISIVIKKSQKYFYDQQKYLGNVNGQVEEIYSGHAIVKVFNKENDTKDTFDKTNEKLYKSAWKSQFISGIMMPIMQFISNIGYVIVVVMGSYLTLKNRIEVGDIQSFIQYVRSFNQPIQQVAQIANQLQTTVAAAERVFDFLEAPEDLKDSKVTYPIENEPTNVTFENVSFGYTKDRTIINNFSATIKEGETVAIVGPTGAGKTTMVKLLMRFYDIDSGKIILGNRNIKDYKKDELRGEFGMVLQDTWLFKGTIEENLKYGKLDATHEEVVAAAKAAHAHRFIQTLPGGYNMELNEEASNVSQGQKQLLTIARAILANPRILILDEATSSVDTRTEIRIKKGMDNLMKGKTSFVIAHRLSTIRDADMILVMDHGDVVEQGTHNELLAKKGFYADLYNSQFDRTA